MPCCYYPDAAAASPKTASPIKKTRPKKTTIRPNCKTLVDFLIDTHTHFDAPLYDNERGAYIERAQKAGVRHVALIGYKACRFERARQAARAINRDGRIKAHLAMGLHPLYIQSHTDADLATLDDFLDAHKNLAIAEIGLDTYPPALKDPTLYAKQKRFFAAQLALADRRNLPVCLHVRKSHAQALALLKTQKFQNGGIAHSFSGGEQEAFAFLQMGFKIGITGQITNPNAKKLHRVVRAVFTKFGATAFVIETDCPDMTPQSFRHLPANEPSTLPAVLAALSAIGGVTKARLACLLWQNTIDALGDHFDAYDPNNAPSSQPAPREGAAFCGRA